MKKITIVFLLALCFSALTFAQSAIHYSLGLRYELASWDYKDLYYYKSWDDAQNDVKTEFGSEMGHLYGPTASINYQKIGFSVTYLMGSWEFPKFPIWYTDGTYIYEDEVTLTEKRSDLILTVSYQVIPRLSIFLGFKSLTLTDEYEFRDLTDANFDSTVSGSGIGGGLSGSYPFSSMFHGYATLGYLSLGGDYEGWGNLIVEGGIRLYLKNTPIFGALGYRYESFTGSDITNDAVLHGPILTVSFYK